MEKQLSEAEKLAKARRSLSRAFTSWANEPRTRDVSEKYLETVGAALRLSILDPKDEFVRAIAAYTEREATSKNVGELVRRAEEAKNRWKHIVN